MSTPSAEWSWNEVKRCFAIGAEVKGIVTRLEHYGVWVDLGIGFDGLLLVTEMAGEIKKGLDEYPQVGEIVSAKVVRHNDDERKLKLSQQA